MAIQWRKTRTAIEQLFIKVMKINLRTHLIVILSEIKALSYPWLWLVASVVMWGVSLALPGFYTGSGEEDVFYGWAILLTGFVFGWMAPGGLAVYANLFFIYVLSLSAVKKSAPKSTISMLLLAAFAFLFYAVSTARGSPDYVIGWGWGAVLWGLSLVSAAFANMAAGSWGVSHYGEKYLRRGYFGVITLCILAVLGVRAWQWSHANLQDRSLLLNAGTAFTVVKLCPEPFVVPKSSLIPPGERVSVLIDDGVGRNPDFWLPELPGVNQMNGMAWVTYQPPAASSIWPVGFKVQVPVVKTRYLLTVKPSSAGSVLRFTDTASSSVLYEQPLRKLKSKGNSGNYYYCPRLSTSSKNERHVPSVHSAILSLFKEKQPGVFTLPQTKALLEEDLVENCPVHYPANQQPRLGDWVDWDSRKVMLTDLMPVSGLCSKTYAAIPVVYVQKINKISDHLIVPRVDVWVFNRKNLLPLYKFSSEYDNSNTALTASGKLVSHDGTPETERNAKLMYLKGLKIGANNTLFVRTIAGDFLLYGKPTFPHNASMPPPVNYGAVFP